MKLITFTVDEKTKIGALTGDRIADLGADEPQLNIDMLSLLNGGEEMMALANETIGQAKTFYALKDVKLESPILNPGKILAIGMNYEKHADEARALGIKVPEKQLWFNKQVTCVNGPFDAIDLPKVSDKLDYEAELAVVIGKRCRHVPRDEAESVIAGYMVSNDVSVRDWQQHTATFTMGKSFDTHGPMGPALVTRDEVSDPHNLNIKCYVNDELRQDSNTRDLIHDCFDQIAYLTQAFTLMPGDILLTGTPSGVGAAMHPPVFLKTGDVVRCEVESLGHIENKVEPES